MFRSQPMRRVELVVPEHDIVAVTETLAHSRLLHLTDPEERGQNESTEQSNVWNQRGSTYTRLEQRIADVMDLLGVEPGPPPDETLHLISPDVAERDIDMLEDEVTGPVGELEQAREKLERLRAIRDRISSLVDMDIELGWFREAEYIFAMLGSMPLDNVDRLQTSLEHVPSVLAVLSEEGGLATVILFGLRRDAEILGRAARSGYLTPFELPEEYTGSPRDALNGVDEGIARAREHITEVQTALRHLHETRILRLRHLRWRVRASRRLVETISRFQQFRYTYLITGWVPAPKIAELHERTSEVSEDTIMDDRVPTRLEQKQAPFQFMNPPFFRMFEGLVTTYGYPGYTELDPTPLLALTFPLIFGAMFGDVGHGLFLSLLGAVLMAGWIPSLKSFAAAGKIVLTCGITTMVFGVLYGSLFGFEELIPALWLRPIRQTTDILVVSVIFGVSVLTLGMVYNVIRAALAQQWGELLFNRNGLAGILFYWSLIALSVGLLGVRVPIVSSLPIALVVIGGVAIALAGVLNPLMAGETVTRALVGSTIVEGFFELFETLLSFLSNTLSYVRMGAFAVAHGALGLVVFILARMIDPGQSVGYWIVVTLGNLVIIAFEGLIVGIQTLRLEYYEFFSKFFTGMGRPYRPLSLVEEEWI